MKRRTLAPDATATEARTVPKIPILWTFHQRIPGLTRYVTFALSILLLASCGVFASPSPTPEPVVINFAFPADLASYYDGLIETFNQEHPHITVERKTARSAETWRYLFRENQVDVFWFTSDGDLFKDLYQDGQILSLTPLIQQSASFDPQDFYPSLLEPYNLEGNVWALPAGVNLAVTYYNKDLFDRYNVAYPESGWTWDDLLMAAMATRDPNEGVYGLVGQPIFVVPFVYQHGGQIVDDWRAPTRLTLDDPLTIEAIEWYTDLIHDYDVMPSPQSAQEQFGNDGSPAYIYWRGKAAMYLGFYSDRGGESWGPQARWQMNWGMVPLPRNERASTLGLLMAYAASADTRHPEACWEWMTYLSEQIPPFVLPARRSLAQSAEYTDQVGAEIAAVARASIEDALILPDVQVADLGEQTESFGEALTEIMNGNVAALEALTALQQQLATQQ
jgi:ABC-type glycerol-3-phosphate transport system substrate-binding protein